MASSPGFDVADKALVTLGDSKTYLYGWQDQLVTGLNASNGPTWSAYNGGVNGAKLVNTGCSGLPVYSAYVDGMLAQMPNVIKTREDSLLNFGVNDMWCGLPSQTTWQNNLLSIIDKALAKYPTGTVWITKPWASGQDANSDTIAGWIDNVIAARPGGQVKQLDDERVWFKPNVATYSTDGVHYDTTAGKAAAAAAKKAAMGL